MAYKNAADRNAYARKWYVENKDRHLALVKKNNAAARAWWPEYKATLKCVRCGESHPACLDFHHRDPATKDLEINQALKQRWNKERVLAEIAKCDVLCANCHRKLHAALAEAAASAPPPAAV